MSAIAGIVNFDGRPVATGSVEAMTAAMFLRGPDGIGHWRNGNVALGQCMLRTTPESVEEVQPLCNEDNSLALVMDGRVDNYQELRYDLLRKGLTLRTIADAELVLRAYELWGEACAERIIGEFAFFVWDARHRRMFGARDPAGTRHFYYHHGDRWFAFASELSALISLKRIKERLNEDRLLDYLSVEFDRDDQVSTFYQDVWRLPAGNVMTVTDKALQITRYWHPERLSEAKFGSYAECREAFAMRLNESIRCRLRSIKPVAAMLSGGLDSSSIVGTISSQFRQLLPSRLQTVSLVQSDRSQCQEWPFVQAMLRDQWLDASVLDPQVVDQKYLCPFEQIRGCNDPFAITHTFVENIVFDHAKQNSANVVLDGMAGDVLFYSLPASIFMAIRYGNWPLVSAIIDGYKFHGFQPDYASVAKHAFLELMPHRSRRVVQSMLRRARMNDVVARDSPDNLLMLLRDDVAQRYVARKWNDRERNGWYDIEETAIQRHAKLFSTGILSFAHEIMGQSALARGIEPRSPFSDRRMLEFAVQMPLHAKLACGSYKQLLRDVMVDTLPTEVRHRTTRGHPGWAFHQRRCTSWFTTARAKSETTQVISRLGHWIDPTKFSALNTRLHASPNYNTLYRRFVLEAASRWLTAAGL